MTRFIEQGHHLLQFLIVLLTFNPIHGQLDNIYLKEIKPDLKKFILGYLFVYIENLLKLYNGSLDQFFAKLFIKPMLDMSVLLKSFFK